MRVHIQNTLPQAQLAGDATFNPLERGLTFFSGRNVLLSLWYSDSTLNAIFKISKMRKVLKREKISDTVWLRK